MNTKSIAILALLLSLASIPTAHSAEDTIDAQITQLRDGLVNSFNRGDIQQLISHLDTNVIVTWQNSEVCVGTEAVKAYYDRMMTGTNRIVAKVNSNPKVLGRHVQGEWCVSWGEMNDHFTLTDGRELPFNSVFTATIAKRGDRWLVSAFHVSVNAFDNSILQLTAKKTGQIVGTLGVLLGAILVLLLRRLLRRAEKASAP